MVTGTYWIWDGVRFIPRSLDRHHHDSYELLDGEAEAPDLNAMAATMAINPNVHVVVAPHFATWDRLGEDGEPLPSPCWSAEWAGTYLWGHSTILISLRWSGDSEGAVGMLAHELCHSVEAALFLALKADDEADAALSQWLRTLRRHGTPEGYPWKWWEGSWGEPLALSYEFWHTNRGQPHGLALPRQVERIYRGIKSGKPEGIMARINGERREWEQDRKGFAADEEAKARKVEEQNRLLEKAKAKWLPKAQAKAEENAAENASDLAKAAALRHTAEALVHGDPKTMEAATALVAESKRSDPELAIKDIRPDKISLGLTSVAKEWTPPTKPEVAQEANQAVADLNEGTGLRGFGRR